MSLLLEIACHRACCRSSFDIDRATADARGVPFELAIDAAHPGFAAERIAVDTSVELVADRTCFRLLGQHERKLGAVHFRARQARSLSVDARVALNPLEAL